MRLVAILIACGAMAAMSACDPGTAADDDGSGIDAAPINDEPPGLEGTVAEHNRVRAETGANLPAMTWDPQLAAIAAAWAAMCVDTTAPTGLINHNPNRGSGYPTSVGENIYGSSSGATGVAAVRSWEGEKVFYDHGTNTCAAGKVCGHYTQIVWRDSIHVGCAKHDCPGLMYGSSIVCDYGPAGNVGGQSPY